MKYLLLAVVVLLLLLVFLGSSEHNRILQGPYVMNSYLARPAEHMSLADVLEGQTRKTNVQLPPVPGLEAATHAELAKRGRMERMTSPMNNAEDPLVYALHGHSVMEAL